MQTMERVHTSNAALALHIQERSRDYLLQPDLDVERDVCQRHMTNDNRDENRKKKIGTENG